MNLTHGVAIYPRDYYYRQGEHTDSGALMKKDYSRMTFTGINGEEGSQKIQQEYLLPHTGVITDFPQDSVYRALSCKSGKAYEDVLAVTIETPDGDVFTYVRDPLQEFSCPVPEPVCYSIDNCR